MNPRFVVPGLLFVAASAVLFGRAGYGPFGNPVQRGKECTADRCVHNASLLALIGTATLLRGDSRRRKESER
jgi:hypothetical protein